MKIVPYDKKYKQEFIDMNIQWISTMFEVEEEDLTVLNNVEEAIQAGGQIFFAIDDQENVLACCMIAPLTNGEWEIEKFCAKGMYTGTGAGSACLKACIDYAKRAACGEDCDRNQYKMQTGSPFIQKVRIYRSACR